MTPEAKQRIQLALTLALVVAGLRAGYILYQRHREYVEGEKQQKQNQEFLHHPRRFVGKLFRCQPPLLFLGSGAS